MWNACKQRHFAGRGALYPTFGVVLKISGALFSSSRPRGRVLTGLQFDKFVRRASDHFLFYNRGENLIL